MSNKHKDTQELYCSVSGKLLTGEEVLFLTSSPENILMLDINKQLPSAHLCIECKREVIELAVQSKILQEFFGTDLTIPINFCEKLGEQLRKKLIELLCLARKSGFIVFGFDKVTEAFKTGKCDFLLRATDSKNVPQKKDTDTALTKIFAVLTSFELGKIIGRNKVVHMAMLKGNAKMSKSILELIAKVNNF